MSVLLAAGLLFIALTVSGVYVVIGGDSREQMLHDAFAFLGLGFAFFVPYTFIFITFVEQLGFAATVGEQEVIKSWALLAWFVSGVCLFWVCRYAGIHINRVLDFDY